MTCSLAHVVRVQTWVPLESGWSRHKHDPVDHLNHVSGFLCTKEGRRGEKKTGKPGAANTRSRDGQLNCRLHTDPHHCPRVRLVNSVLQPKGATRPNTCVGWDAASPDGLWEKQRPAQIISKYLESSLTQSSVTVK